MAAGYWFFKTKAKHSMGTRYHQLTPEERYPTQALNRCDYSARRIAQILGRSNKTVLNEFYQVTLRKKIDNSVEELQIDLGHWLLKYNT